MKKNYSIIIGLLVISPLLVWGQGTISGKATRNEQMNHFVDASDAYQGLYVRGDREASLLAARNLYKARRYEEALPLYEFADSLKIITDAEQVFAFFECLKSVKRYAEADALVKTRLGEFASRPEFGLHHEKLGFYQNVGSYKGAEVKALALNSKFSDISPTVYNGWLYFVSTRPSTGNHTVHRINMQPFYNLYGTPADKGGPEVADPKGDFGKAAQKISLGGSEAVSLPEGINKKFHDGPVNVTPSGKYMFFTTNHFEGRKAKDVVNLMIYYSQNKDGVWQTPQALPSNALSYSNQHGFFDETTSTLYFASNRPGGQGGWDIWKTKMESNGSWSEAENLGAGVNTVKTEVFPSLSPDGTLIFASNGWPGLGGLDLFLSQTGSEPLNLLAGVNSEKDDFGLVFSGKEGGYLVSNRPGGTGDDDIYSFTMKFDVAEIQKYNRYEVPVAISLKDNGSGGKIASANATLTRDGVQKPVVIKDGETIGLMAGDVLKFDAEGYKPAELAITDANLDAKQASVGMDAKPKAVPGVAFSVTDSQTGEVIPAQLTVQGQPVGAAGGPAIVKEGDLVRITSPGYVPAEVRVTADMLKAGASNVALVKQSAGDTPLLVTATAGKGGPGLPVHVTVNRAQGRQPASYGLNLPQGGEQIPLAAGDELLIISEGYVPAKVVVTKEMVKAGKVTAALKESSGDVQVLVSAVDGAGTGVPANVSVKRKKGRQPAGYSVTTPAGGQSIPLAEGDVLTVTGSGFGAAQVVVTKAMLDAGRISVGLQALAAIDPATVAYAPIYFDYKQWIILPASKKILDKLVKDMKANESLKVEIRAYTDCRGDISSNQALSENRVNAVLEYLRSRVGADRLKGGGYGESDLVNDCACEGAVKATCSEPEHRLNRRAVIVPLGNR